MQNMQIRFAAVVAFLILQFTPASAQRQMISDLKPVCDSLTVWLKERTSVTSGVKLSKVMKRGDVLDMYFTKTFSDYPWKEADVKWFREQFEKNFPSSLKKYAIGGMYCKDVPIDQLVTPRLGNDGKPASYKYAVDAPARSVPFIRKVGAKRFSKGLDNRYIALWQSHGRYYNANEDAWKWQRPPLHRTLEDIYTQSYVLPFLLPMLENSGAYVLTPRERDTQVLEVVCDNDPSFRDDRGPECRREGKYSEKGSWKDAGEGFADFKKYLVLKDNPFRAGSARSASCVKDAKPSAVAAWTPDFAERGRYSVYVSFKSLPESSTSAHYTVRHLGGTSEFLVDQTRGGGTWIYLGTFEFDKGSECGVTLDNSTAPGCDFVKGSIVTADAVRFGGGMGKVARGWDDSSAKDFSVSGMPSYLEGSKYWLQWAGMDADLTDEWESDYVKDYAGRGVWVKWMSKAKKIPFDLSLGFHSDAGVTPSDSTVGTLAIYTLKCDGSRKLGNGGDRMACRLLCDYVQSQVCNDIRSGLNPDWSRREIWDRSYSESRTTDVPAMILELLSHQNFADMKYGLDPAFRFIVSRAVYKGILKFLSTYYSVPYAVQPLPVRNFSAILSGEDSVRLEWTPGEDKSEPTAVPKGYVVYTRVDDGVFDGGREVKGTSVTLGVKPGHIYSYKVVAFNDGGFSFPSEVLSAGVSGSFDASKTVLVVNNFSRVSGPTWIDTPDYAGFDGRLDSGVPYIEDINYAGENYEFRRSLEWQSDDVPGFGASYTDHATMKVAGNTFDYPSVHGRELMALGWSFCSQSAAAFDGNSRAGFKILDLICGKQVTCPGGRYQVFPADLRKALYAFTEAGGNLIVSGADIATDVWDEVYPGTGDEFYQNVSQEFVRSTLGFKFVSGRGSSDGRLFFSPSKSAKPAAMRIVNTPCGQCYAVESPDAIKPTGTRGQVVCRYPGDVPAAVAFKGKTHKAVSFGFPLEALSSRDDMRSLLSYSLDFLSK